MNALGESAVTPGLVGEERRKELLRRLMNAVCGNEESSDDDCDDEEEEEEEIYETAISTEESEPIQLQPPPYREPITTLPPELPPTLQEASPSPLRLPSPPPPPSLEPIQPDLISAPVVNINELKNDLKRLLNKRELFIAYKLSGSSQDVQLKETESKITRLGFEIEMFNGVLQRKELSVLPPHAVKSQFLSRYSSSSIDIHLDDYVAFLETLKEECKEKVIF